MPLLPVHSSRLCKAILAQNFISRFTFARIREGFYPEFLPLYTSFVDLDYSQSGVKLQEHTNCGPGIAWTKIGDFGEATARLVKDYVDSSVRMHYR